VYTVDLLFDGNFTEAAIPTQPGIKAIRDYMKSLPYDQAELRAGHFTWFNNDSPFFRLLPDGTVDAKGRPVAARFPRPKSHHRRCVER